MPGFATGDDHQGQRHPAVQGARRHLRGDRHPAGGASRCSTDLGHPFADGEEVYDVTFENVQAGLRTDYLFRLANQRGGIVLGTGDLSELALGWCTYGVGDQMSHYTVNAGVPKTLIQHLIRWVVDSEQFGAEDDEIGELLTEILDQEISPELVPAARGRASRRPPRSTIGPYALQDFTLFHVLRYGFRPSKIAFLAEHAWSDADGGGVAAGLPRGPRVRRTTSATIRALAGGLRPALLRQPVQAVRAAQRAEGQRRRHHVAARRLADAVRRRARRPGWPSCENVPERLRRAGRRRSWSSSTRTTVRRRWSGEWLVEAGCGLDVRRPYAGDPLPDDARRSRGAFLVLGGSMGADDDDGAPPGSTPTKALVRDAAERGTPHPRHLPRATSSRPWRSAARWHATRAASSSACSPMGWTDAAASRDRAEGRSRLRPRVGVHWNDDIVDAGARGHRRCSRGPASVRSRWRASRRRSGVSSCTRRSTSRSCGAWAEPRSRTATPTA